MKSGRVYNKAMLEFLAENYPKMYLPELTAAFNKNFRKQKTANQIKACLQNHGIKAGVKRTRTPRRYLDKHLQFLQERYLVLNLEQLTDAFNKEFPSFKANIKSIRACLRNHKIRSGRTGHFEEGKESWNKGMKGLNTGGEKGWFKKGALSLNQRPIGSERVNVDGYVEIKVQDPNIWKPKHRVVWEREHGPIEKGYNIRFLDSNKLNCDISNLVKVSDSENKYLNILEFKNAPEELRETLLLIAKVNSKTKSLIKLGGNGD